MDTNKNDYLPLPTVNWNEPTGNAKEESARECCGDGLLVPPTINWKEEAERQDGSGIPLPRML